MERWTLEVWSFVRGRNCHADRAVRGAGPRVISEHGSLAEARKAMQKCLENDRKAGKPLLWYGVFRWDQ